MWKPIFSPNQLRTLMEIKPQDIQNDWLARLQGLPISISLHQGHHISWHIMETKFIQQKGGCLPTITEKPERLCISPILSYRESSEKSSNRHGHNNYNNPSLAKSSLVPKSPTNEHKKSNSNPLNRWPFMEPRDSKTTSCDKKNTAISDLSSFWEKLFAERLSEQAISLLPRYQKERHNKSLWIALEKVEWLVLWTSFEYHSV